METNSLNQYLPELISFHEVAKSGGFTQAATKLNLSKGQLSKQVAVLETILRAQLFHRTTRKISLTEEGKHLLKYAEGIVNLSSEAAQSMQSLIDSDAGLIRITAPGSLGDWFGPELLKLFQAKAPELRVECDFSNVKRDLIQENFDFALRAMDETNPDLIARYIGHLKDVVVATPAMIKKQKVKGSDPNELAGLPCLASSHQRSWNSWKLQKGSRDLVVDVQGSYASSSYSALKMMAMADLGIARLPYYLVSDEISRGKLVHLYQDYSISTHPLYLVYPSSGYRMKKQKLARDLIWEWMKNQKVMFQS